MAVIASSARSLRTVAMCTWSASVSSSSRAIYRGQAGHLSFGWMSRAMISVQTTLLWSSCMLSRSSSSEIRGALCPALGSTSLPPVVVQAHGRVQVALLDRVVTTVSLGGAGAPLLHTQVHSISHRNKLQAARSQQGDGVHAPDLPIDLKDKAVFRLGSPPPRRSTALSLRLTSDKCSHR